MLTETILTNDMESLFDSVADNTFIQNSFAQPKYDPSTPEIQIVRDCTEITKMKNFKSDTENMLEK